MSAPSCPIRLSLGQFQQNPFQKGCTSALVATPGCATVALDINGFSPPALAQSAEQAGLGRHDTRTIIGTRWEHDFDKDTMWRTQFVFDDKNINQPTGTTSAIGDTPAFNPMTDITRKGSLLGLDTTHFGQVFFNEERLSNFTYNVVPGGSASLGKLSSYYDGGYQENFGARAREEVKLSDKWTFVTAAARAHEDSRHQRAQVVFARRSGNPQSFRCARRLPELGAGSGRALSGRRRVAVSRPGRHRVRHAANQQPDDNAARRFRQ